jgi:dihydrofolate synthase/folylpolyglutamate synthase
MSKNLFSSIADVFAWLESFSNFEKNSFALRSFRLDRMEKLLDLFGRPHETCRCLHVAGSKGKGSTAAFLSSVLRAGGYKTGLYTSPHLVSYKERISLAGEEIPDEFFLRQAGNLRAEIERFDPSYFPNGEYPTTFELLTCLGFLIFREMRCDWVVLETGMGGRLDATNVVLPAAAIITPIELEHTEYLGESIAAIAEEKAGIIKDGVPVFLSPQTEEALGVFRSRAEARGCALYHLPECFQTITCRTLVSGTQAVFVRAATQERFSPKLRLLGEVQAENAALALLVIQTILPEIPVPVIIRGLEAAYLPGRFQKLEDSPPIFVDGSHTPLSVRRLLHSFREMYPEPDTLILGIIGGKRHEEIAGILCPCFRSVIVTTPGTFKASDPDKLFRTCLGYNKKSRLIPDPAEALDAAWRGLPGSGQPILITGSFYLAGEILKLYKPLPRGAAE